MKLAIISHTEHYKTADNQIVGWGATVSEINYLLEIFDEVYHLAMLYNQPPPASALPYTSNRIHFISIPAVGGRGVYNKLRILWQSPKIIGIVSKTLKKVDFFQLRTPTGIGVFLIPYLTLCIKNKGWYKYAGNWNQEQPPLGYRIQRWMLKHQNRTVTINGMWPNQPKNHLSFENPCLSNADINLGKQIRQDKGLKDKISFCFVGRLEKEKGVELIINAFNSLKDVSRIGTVHLVGEGQGINYFKSIANQRDIKFMFHGALPRGEVFEIYKKSEVFLLPTSASEGFPKVIAEAMNFGCLPIVSNVSAIGHYIKNRENGLVFENVTLENLIFKTKMALNLEHTEYKKLLGTFEETVCKFTFSHYNSRIKQEILKQ
ncbi:glycosyltransferase family 4 protein [Seonamhaeicola maritimus]|uniref:Glycosyltransferase n=1 Tax=Seonamhaeicola maritimus TaxID=2591822 RepID=A0A5C7GKT0_9FLAO|nr:glycosyltransferase [Seonamhaeicola maritimus]TXG38880.1 glycosyltransferase [Seonamhaeicola maritimus]